MKHEDTFKTERRVTAKEILEEIAPLLREYFIATCRKNKHSIVMRFPSGQEVTVFVTA